MFNRANGKLKMHLQAFVSYTSPWTPYTVQAVTAQNTDRIPAFWCCRGQPKYSLFDYIATICELRFCGRFELAIFLEKQCIGRLIVTADTTFDRIVIDNSRMPCEKRVDPPSVLCKF